MKRTMALDVRESAMGTPVLLEGWVATRRDHGGVVFIDLRDRSGIIQVVFEPGSSGGETHGAAHRLRAEYVLRIEGTVRKRSPETVNPRMATGEIEVVASNLEILSVSDPLPFPIEDESDASEEVRLKYRYLDLRTTRMRDSLIKRSRGAAAVRNSLASMGFIEIETPMLTKSTPEGARDYLVPSRVQPGRFFALPQSPQLFKQILMVAGMERYYQIVRCFRDEDLRADRQPEFTQIDIEMSFIEEEDIFETCEEMLAALFSEVAGVEIPRPFPRLPYDEVILKYGTDKPDLRYGLEITDITSLASGCGFKVFRETAEAGGVVRGIRLPGGGLSRKEIDDLTSFAAGHGARGLAYFHARNGGLESTIAKFFSTGELDAIRAAFGARDGDMILFVADNAEVAAESLGALRKRLAEMRDLIDSDALSFLWVTSFPLFEWDEKANRWSSMHHPFTSPDPDGLARLDEDPSAAKARAYDCVLNGMEIGGGSIRIHRSDVQSRIFDLLGISEEDARVKFGFLLDALRFGAPPHGGIAFGFDRLMMILTKGQSIRDVIAFPKTQNAACPMTQAPSEVSSEQLKELSIKLVSPE